MRSWPGRRRRWRRGRPIVLDGFRLRSDAKIVRWPDRYMDERGREFWGRVLRPTSGERASPDGYGVTPSEFLPAAMFQTSGPLRYAVEAVFVFSTFSGKVTFRELVEKMSLYYGLRRRCSRSLQACSFQARIVSCVSKYLRNNLTRVKRGTRAESLPALSSASLPRPGAFKPNFVIAAKAVFETFPNVLVWSIPGTSLNNLTIAPFQNRSDRMFFTVM